MTRNEIDAIFTAKVTGLLNQGYTINPATMYGSQGEIAKVDLRKGDEIIRVYMDTEFSPSFRGLNMLTIRVGRTTKPRALNRQYDDIYNGIWNNELEVLEETRYGIVENSIYVTEEETATIIAKRRARLENHYTRGIFERPVNLTDMPGAKAIALRYIKRQPKMKATKLSEIEKIFKVNGTYRIKARGKEFRLA